MMYKAKVVVCSEIRTKHLTQSEHSVEFLNVKSRIDVNYFSDLFRLCTNVVAYGLLRVFVVGHYKGG
jgi:hypothetical protein